MLANAVKFTERGEVVIHVALDKGAPAEDGRQHFHVTIRDTGIGISPESMKKLFQVFRQGHESMSRRYGGTGEPKPASGIQQWLLSCHLDACVWSNTVAHGVASCAMMAGAQQPLELEGMF